MQVVNGKEKEVIGMLGAYGLGGYEARMYFTLLALGKGKAIEITRKASVLQSKAYTVLDSLIDKGFVELSGTDRPKVYRVRALEEATGLTIKARQSEIRELEKYGERLGSILETITPVHRQYKDVWLFTPSYHRPKIKEGD